jgi:hypothetical protein
MRVTVIFEDNTIIVDGVAKIMQTMPAFDANWTALQWYGAHGTIEVKLGDRIWLTDLATVQPFIDAWEAQPLPETDEAVLEL